jgi:16S rRNA (cytosine1402-N4)-methyltransferase
MGSEGRLLALDKDPEAIASPEADTLRGDERFQLRHASFGGIEALAEATDWTGRVDAVLMDLGVSSPQLDQAERGFSFMREGPLDMRMNTTEGPTAADWLLTIGQRELADVLWTYGEERCSRRIAEAIVRERNRTPIVTTKDLVRLIEGVVKGGDPHKHPATRTFQAIRIALNEELSELERGLGAALEVLRPGGRLVVIAFHSLEDRIVKRFFRDEERGWRAGDPMPLLGRTHQGRLHRMGKAIKPSPEEVRANIRSRSAVMRIAEKI